MGKSIGAKFECTQENRDLLGNGRIGQVFYTACTALAVAPDRMTVSI